MNGNVTNKNNLTPLIVKSTALISTVTAVTALLVAFTDFGAVVFNGFEGLFDSKEKRLLERHRKDTPHKTFTLKYEKTPSDKRDIIIDIYKNADVAVQYLGSVEWLEFDESNFESPALNAIFGISTAYAKEYDEVSANGDFKKISIVQACNFCIRDNSYTYKIYENLSVDVLETDEDGKIVSEKKIEKVKNIEDLVGFLKLGDYYSQSIPINKEKNLRKSANIPDNEKIVSIVDATIFGSASNGIAIGESGIYVNNGWPDDSFNIRYDELLTAEIEVQSPDYYTRVGNKRIDTPGSSLDGHQLEAILQIIKIAGQYCTPEMNTDFCRAFINQSSANK